MSRLRVLILAGILLMVCCRAVVAAEVPAAVDPEDALVLVNTRSVMGRFAGNGFVIGDGTLAVTAHHLVFEKSKKGPHKMGGFVFVASPYLGEGIEAEIVAADEELDLAVLKIPWKGHPALRLADESDLLSAERLVVTGIPEIVRSIGASGYEPLSENIDAWSEDLAVDYVAVRQKNPRFISLSETGRLGPGWSGSPILLPESNIAAGCFTALQRRRDESGEVKGAKGPAVNQIGRLLNKSEYEQSLLPCDSRLSKPEDATDAFLLLVQSSHHYSNRQYGWASDRMERFLELRPESCFGYTHSAMIAEKQERFDLAERHHRKALELNPGATGSRFYYAQFLSDRRPDEALEIFQEMWKIDEMKPAVTLLMFNILAGRNEFQRAGELLEEALKINPENAYLRMNLGACQHRLGKTDEAIANFTKAVELLPERGPFRGQLAHILEKAGRLDEAEKHFRELLNIEPKNPVVHLWLARFLGKHRPEAKDEALKEARIALELPRRKGLPKEKIEQVIQELQSETEPTLAP